MDAAFIGHMAHKAVQSVDFSDQMALAEAANGGITGHGANSRKSVGDHGGLCTHAGGRSRGLTTGMTAANYDNVESHLHKNL